MSFYLEHRKKTAVAEITIAENIPWGRGTKGCACVHQVVLWHSKLHASYKLLSLYVSGATGVKMKTKSNLSHFCASVCFKDAVVMPLCSMQCIDQGEETPDWTGWKLLTMAGLFDCWTPPGGGEPLYSYSVITVNASPNLQSIHHR